MRFGDVDPRAHALPSVRAQIGSVMQDVRLFTGSIRDNIAGEDSRIDLEAVVGAARLAEIAAEIERMPMAYETVLTEAGANVSAGQRQRLALAKALVVPRPIVVLDEATSALDSVTEARIQQHLERLRCTRMVIAHRLSTIRNADRIVVMVAGRIVEQGRHDELLARRGAYFTLVGAQAGVA